MWILLVILVLLIIFVILTFNSLTTLRQKVRNSWSQIDVQLQRRFDLIPNLVETIKGYMQHEQDVLTKVTELRSSWANANTVSQKSELDTQLSGVLEKIIVISENYPELKSSKNFSELQSELKNTEDKIAYARQFYNDIVTIYNTKLQIFPCNIIGSIFNFSSESLFQVESEKARKNIDIGEKFS